MELSIHFNFFMLQFYDTIENSKKKVLNFLTFCLGRVGGDGVEDVDQDEEESDQERHPPRDDVWRNHEAGQAVRFCSGQECHV